MADAKNNYKAYRQGYRSCKFHKTRYKYWHNPYPYQTTLWHSFNIGWNDYLQGIIL